MDGDAVATTQVRAAIIDPSRFASCRHSGREQGFGDAFPDDAQEGIRGQGRSHERIAHRGRSPTYGFRLARGCAAS
jgi:hypothetical protein